MQIGKQKTSSEEDKYIHKISELRATFEDIVEKVSSAQGELDIILQSKERAESEKNSISTQIVALKKELSELQELIFKRVQELNKVVLDINGNLLQGESSILIKKQILDSVNNEIKKVKVIIDKLSSVKEEYKINKVQNDSLKFSNKNLKAENEKIKNEIARNREMQIKDLPYWQRLRSDAEHLFLNASAKQEFVHMAIDQLRNFCAENNIPFDINLKI